MTLRLGYETRVRMAELIFDVVDGFVQSRGLGDSHPRPLEPLYFYVIEMHVDGVAQPMNPPLELVMQRNLSGYHLFFGSVKMQDGSVRQKMLAPGQYTVRIETRPNTFPNRERGVPGVYQPTNVLVDLPMPDPRDPAANTPYAIVLTPAPAYPFPHATPLRLDFPVPSGCSGTNLPIASGPTLLRGNLHQRDGRPLAGARVRPASWPAGQAYTTGPDGGWVLVFPEDQTTGEIVLHFSLPQPGAAPSEVDVPDVCVVRGFECSLSQTALRGWATDRGRPISRFTLQIAGGISYTDLEIASADGGWFYYFDLNQPSDIVAVTAMLPDGRTLVEQNVLVQPRATVVVPAFQFE